WCGVGAVWFDGAAGPTSRAGLTGNLRRRAQLPGWIPASREGDIDGHLGGAGVAGTTPAAGTMAGVAHGLRGPHVRARVALGTVDSPRCHTAADCADSRARDCGCRRPHPGHAGRREWETEPVVIRRRRRAASWIDSWDRQCAGTRITGPARATTHPPSRRV